MNDDTVPTPIVNYEDAPGGFTPCFLSEWPKQAECVRYAVGQSIPAGPRIGSSVYPQTLQGSAACPYFLPLRVIREAWGLTPLFEDVKERDAHALRMAVEGFLGSHTSYYRYNTGERTLTPEQQDHILQIFARRGYDTSQLRFAHYRDTVDYHED